MNDKTWKLKGLVNDKKIVDIEVSVEYHKTLEDHYIHITKGCITGYESASLTNLSKNREGWLACFGGMGYDKLMLKPEELNPVLDEINKFLEGK